VAGMSLGEEEARVLRAAKHVVAASGVPSVHALAVAAQLRDDQAQGVAEALVQRGLLDVALSSRAEQESEWLATRRYRLIDQGAAALGEDV